MKIEKFASVVLLLLVVSLLANARNSSVTFTSNEHVRESNVESDPAELSLILNPNGFSPNQAELDNGNFLLSVDNRSGANELVLNFSRSDGTLIREIKVAGAGGDWQEAFNLPAGLYQLKEANHSAWTCTITIH